MQRRAPFLLVIALAGAFALLPASSVPAAPTAVDLQLDVGASGTLPTNVPPTVNGGTVNLASLSFYVFVDVALITPAPARAKIRFELGEGLRWGPDDPDPTEGCTSTPTTGECTTPELQPVTGSSIVGWYWQVVAAQPGTYTWKAEIVEASDTDPNPANNSSQITLVVSTGSGSGGGGSGGGGDGGSGGSAAATASAAKLTPAKPKAGSAVTASVRVSAGGAPLRPTGVTCAGAIGSLKVKGTPRAASGAASCTFRTPRAAKGKTLTGAVSFRAGGKQFTKRFSVRLG